MGHFVGRVSLLAIAWGISPWLTAATGLADDDHSAPRAGGKTFSIAIPEFAVSEARGADIALRIRQVIVDRVLRLDAYALSDATKAVSQTDANRLPDFDAWQSRNVQFVMVALVTRVSDVKLKVEVRVWNVRDRRQAYGGQVFAPIESWQQAADFLADEIGGRLTDHAAVGERPKGD